MDDNKKESERKAKLSRLEIRLLARQAEGLDLDAQIKILQWDDVSKMMVNALEWIDETEKVIQDLPDTLELKAMMLDDLIEAREGHKNNDPIKTIRLFPRIREDFGNAQIALNGIKVLKDKESGSKGGSKPKRKEWAELVAFKLKKEY